MRSLLGRKLTVDDAVQIAMLNNRELQAVYSDLGLAQADLVQAGLFKNPILDAAILFPLSGVRPDLPARRGHQPPGCALRAAPKAGGHRPVRGGQAPRHRGRARFHGPGAPGRSTYTRRMSRWWSCAARLSRRSPPRWMSPDGSTKRGISRISTWSRDRAQTEASKVMLRSAESDAQQSREQLNSLLGAWGEDTGWEIDGRMPDIPAEPLQMNGVERVALARSIDLSHGRQQIIVAGQQLGYSRAKRPRPGCGRRGKRREGGRRVMEGGAGDHGPHSTLRSGASADRAGRRGATARSAGVLRPGSAHPLHGPRRPGPDRRRARSRPILPGHSAAIA